MEATDRHEKALALRAQYKSFRRIGEELGVSHEQARQYVISAIAAAKERIATAGEELRAEEMARMDQMSVVYGERALEGDIRAAEMWLKLRTRWAALGGVDKAVPRAVAPEEEAAARGWAPPPTATPEEVEVLRSVVAKIRAAREGTPVQVTDDQGRPVRAELLPEGE